MELLAATLGARLSQSVMRAIDFHGAEITFWSDSSTVLSWLRQGKQWSKFVFNRVEEIKRLTDITSWRHVPGTFNPADLPSRGCTAQQLLKSRWWEGPTWLQRLSSEWPREDFTIDVGEVNLELCKSRRKSDAVNNVPLDTGVCATLHCREATAHDATIPWYMFNCSNYNRILRIMAWILRFTSNAKVSKNPRKTVGYLKVDEIDSAEKRIIRLAQVDSFDGYNDSRIKGLNVYLDESGLIRKKTLISNRIDTEDFRFPAILDRNHQFTKLFIRHTHERLKHAGISTTMSTLREKVWILSSRRAVCSIIGSCFICHRYSAKSLDVPPPSLL